MKNTNYESYLHFHLAVSLFGPNIIFITLLVNTPYLYYSLKANLHWGTWLQTSAWNPNSNRKRQSKYVLMNAMKACGEDKCIVRLILNCSTEVSCELYAPAVLPQGKGHSLNRRLGDPQSRRGRIWEKKNVLLLLGIESLFLYGSALILVAV